MEIPKGANPDFTIPKQENNSGDGTGMNIPKSSGGGSNTSSSGGSKTKTDAWGFFIRGLIISALIFGIFGNLALLIKMLIFAGSVAILNLKEEKKLIRCGYLAGVTALIFLLRHFLGGVPFLGDALKMLPDFAWLWTPAAYHLLHDIKEGTINKGRRDRPFSITEVLITIGCVVVLVVIAVLAALNAKPWIELAGLIVKELLEGEFRIIFENTPLGDMVRFLAFFIGVCLWAFCQCIQIIPIVLKNDVVLGDKLRNAAKSNDLVKKALSNLTLIRTLAYVFEVLVCISVYMPYRGGWSAIFRDLPMLDPDKIDWMVFPILILTVIGFELLVQVAMSLFSLRKAAVA